MPSDILDPLALEVSTASGYVSSFDYVNTLRHIFKMAPMTEQEFELAAARCVAAGRDAVMLAHQYARLELVRELDKLPADIPRHK